MRNASGHQGENERQRKKNEVNRNTYVAVNFLFQLIFVFPLF